LLGGLSNVTEKLFLKTTNVPLKHTELKRGVTWDCDHTHRTSRGWFPVFHRHHTSLTDGGHSHLVTDCTDESLRLDIVKSVLMTSDYFYFIIMCKFALT
jgi:hypothetical protein